MATYNVNLEGQVLGSTVADWVAEGEQRALWQWRSEHGRWPVEQMEEDEARLQTQSNRLLLWALAAGAAASTEQVGLAYFYQEHNFVSALLLAVLMIGGLMLTAVGLVLEYAAPRIAIELEAERGNPAEHGEHGSMAA